MQITSPTNPHIRRWSALKRAAQRKRQGFFLIEGVREIIRFLTTIPQHGGRLEALFCSAACETLTPYQPTYVTETVLAKLSVRQNPPTAIAVATRPPASATTLANVTCLLIADHLQKPGNLGALLRTLDAVGQSGAYATTTSCDWYAPGVIRASVGSCFHLPLMTGSHDTLLTMLQDRTLYTLDPTATTPFYAVDWTQKVAIVVGDEAFGLSPAWQPHAQPISIPMFGQLDSLNASVAGALVLYESIRQRRSL